MASVRVEVELDEFSNDELIHELDWRVNNKNGKKEVQSELKSRIVDEVLHNSTKTISKDGRTLVNQMKIDFLIENIEKISLEKLESLIP